jgi:asparagine synthase (glutamine-hydrolysing)
LFAAIFNFDRRPVDLTSVGLTGAARVEILGRFGHVALICVNDGLVGADADLSGIVEHENRCWIVGRIRLDARDELRSRLSLPSRGGAGEISDAMLCLLAYAAWGDCFLEHLAGDFCFALWDDRNERLICARDQLGVRSLFHAAAGSGVVSDRLGWIASLPQYGRSLDDYWIADFLVANVCVDLERTVYRDIRRVAPAHVLTMSEKGAAIRRYWRLDVEEPLRFRDSRLYGVRFRELLSHAIADRMPKETVGVSMSGGLDSTTLAAAAVEVAGDPSRVVAECDYFERLMPDEEKHFSSLVARHLGIDLQLRAFDDMVYDPQWRERPFSYAEPSIVIATAHTDRLVAREMACRAGVWFYGEGPDNALALDRDAYFSWLARRRDWSGLARSLFQYVQVKGWRGWAATLRRHTQPGRSAPPRIEMPAWLEGGLVERLHLVERVAHIGDAEGPPHPWHPAAMASFGGPAWQRVLGDLELDELAAAFVWRHPFLDLRVLRFMLSVPPVPWAWEKQLLRDAMRGRLPPQVLARRKAPLAQSPLEHKLRRHPLPDLTSSHRLAPYVDLAKLQGAERPGGERWNVLAVHALDHWLEIHQT